MIGCLLFLLSFLTPRIVLVILWLSGYLGRAYDTFIWPLLGFIFFPFTTLAYAFAYNQTAGAINGLWIALIVLAVLFDLGTYGGGGTKYRTRRDLG